MLKMESSQNLVLGIINDTHRSTDSARSQQVSWPDVAAVDCVMGKLLLHGPVYVLQAEREMDQYEWGGAEFAIFIKEATGQTCFCILVVQQEGRVHKPKYVG